MSYSEIYELSRIKQLIGKGNHLEALQLVKKFEENADNNPSDILSYQLLKCEIFFQQGSYDDVINIAKHSYKKSLELGMKLRSVDALNIMAFALIWKGNFEEAGEIIKESQTLLKNSEPDFPSEIKKREASINFVSGYYYEQNDINRSIEHLERSLILREEIGDGAEVAKSLIRLGFVLGVYKGKLDNAFKYTERGLAIAEEISLKHWHAEGFNTLACLYDLKRESSLGITYFEKSLAIFKELNNEHRIAFTLNNIARAYQMKGEMDHALRCLEQCIALLNKLGMKFAVAVTQDYLIQVLVEKGDIVRAREILN
ncbi:MAG: tetratricopeptide repeat protein, partial [Promethearchaeota archaeon]